MSGCSRDYGARDVKRARRFATGSDHPPESTAAGDRGSALEVPNGGREIGAAIVIGSAVRADSHSPSPAAPSACSLWSPFDLLRRGRMSYRLIISLSVVAFMCRSSAAFF